MTKMMRRVLGAAALALAVLAGCQSSDSVGDPPDPPDDTPVVPTGDASLIPPDSGPLHVDSAVVNVPDGALPPNPDGSVLQAPDAAPVATPDASAVVPDATVVTADATIVSPDAAPVGGATLQVCASGAAHSSIGAAIAAANSGDLIEVCAGTYLERLLIEGKALRIRGAGATSTTLDAGGGGAALIVRASAGVSFEGFTVRGGASGLEGGALRCEGSPFELRATTVIGNVAQGGGGLYASACTLTVAGNRFEGNRGGARGGGALIIDSSGEIADSHFIGNHARDGGGMMMLGGSVALRRNIFGNNSAELQGGGLHHASLAPIEENTVAGNNAGWTGGGIYMANHPTTLLRNTISGNTSLNDGGGLYVHMADVVLIENIVQNNTSDDDGGGVRIFTSRCRMERNRVLDNTSGDGGGGIRISHLPCLLIDNTIHHNKATIGGGIDCDNDSSVIRGGVVSRNNASRGAGISMELAPWNGATIEGVQFIDNNSNRGALYLQDNFQPVTLRDLTFTNNSSRRGGGLYATGTVFTLSHGLFNDNDTTVEGGAIYLGANEPWQGLDGGSPGMCPCPPENPTVLLDFVTVYGSESPKGSAVFVAAPPGITIKNSIFAGSAAPVVVVAQPPDVMMATTPPSWLYNDTIPSSFDGMGNPNGSDGNLSADPQFVNPAAGDFHLMAGSPARDAGDPAQQDADGTRADMGAYGGK